MTPVLAVEPVSIEVVFVYRVFESIVSRKKPVWITTLSIRGDKMSNVGYHNTHLSGESSHQMNVNFFYYQNKAGVKPAGQMCWFQPAFNRNNLKCANMDPGEFLLAHLCHMQWPIREKIFSPNLAGTLIPFTSFYCSYIFTPIQRNYTSCFMLRFTVFHSMSRSAQHLVYYTHATKAIPNQITAFPDCYHPAFII